MQEYLQNHNIGSIIMIKCYNIKKMKEGVRMQNVKSDKIQRMKLRAELASGKRPVALEIGRAHV